jgi:hypothetical protein
MSKATVTQPDDRGTTVKNNSVTQSKLKSQLLAVFLLISSVGGTLGLFCGVPALARVTFMWQQAMTERSNVLSR